MGSPADINSFLKTDKDICPSVTTIEAKPKKKRKIQKNKQRCWECKKKLGLTGIECRCGYVFCGIPRYEDSHSCDFNFKEFGRENLSKANPKLETSAGMEDKL